MTKVGQSQSGQVLWWRFALVTIVFVAFAGALVWRAVDLQFFNKDFLQTQGDARHLRVVAVPAHRGVIYDRRNEPLAMSTPVDSIWAEPNELLNASGSIVPLAKALDMKPAALRERLIERRNKEFVYLRRHMSPHEAEKVLALSVPGVNVQREYQRYYPMAEVAGHLVGFANVDDVGQEGIELAFDSWVQGEPGAKRVVRDRVGHVIENVESIREPNPGKNIVLSIDKRIQFLAYRELKKAVVKHKAKSGSAVVLDAQTGEILAMVNQPAFNPNNVSERVSSRYRNRALTDVFEPGSTVKPFSIAAALDAGVVKKHTRIDTAPGLIRVGGNTIRDAKNYGVLDMAGIIQKSSNVGLTRVALAMPETRLWQVFNQLGFGQPTGLSFPGEASGVLTQKTRYAEVERATMSYGYGFSTTSVQLAQAYTAFANHGVLLPVSLMKLEQSPKGQRVFSEQSANSVLHMMEAVVAEGGTAPLAAVSRYRVAGKTGTIRKADPLGGYTEDKYVGLFAGIAPVSNPRLIMVVMIDEPGGEYFYGGIVAAPVFSAVMEGAMRILNISPDDPAVWQAEHGKGDKAA